MTLAAVLMGMTAANAQLVLGGSLNFSGNTGDVDKNKEQGITYKGDDKFGMAIAPKIGYMFMDQKMEAGAALYFGYNETMNYDVMFKTTILDVAPYIKYTDGKPFKDYKESSFAFYFQPYLRGRLVGVKGFGIWLEGIASLGTSIEFQDKYYAYKYGDEIGRSEEEAKELNKEPELKSNNFIGSLSIKPVLTYDINEHWRLETGLNFLSLYLGGAVYNNEYYTDQVAKTKGIETYNTFNYGIAVSGSDIIGKQIGYITIGAAYKF